MGALKKYKDHYPTEAKKVAEVQDTKKSSQKDKQVIDAYLNKINDLLESPEKQKKAALIISQLINSKK